MNIEVKSTAEFNDFAARRILSIIEATVDHQGHCTVALSGGNTPKEVYAHIANLYPEYDINWRRVFFFGEMKGWLVLRMPITMPIWRMSICWMPCLFLILTYFLFGQNWGPKQPPQIWRKNQKSF